MKGDTFYFHAHFSSVHAYGYTAASLGFLQTLKDAHYSFTSIHFSLRAWEKEMSCAGGKLLCLGNCRTWELPWKLLHMQEETPDVLLFRCSGGSPGAVTAFAPSRDLWQLEQPGTVVLLCKWMRSRAVGATATLFAWVLAKQSLQREK